MCALSPRDGIVRLPEEEGSVYVRPGLDPADALVLDWRDGDVT